jgi:hypothetical protein
VVDLRRRKRVHQLDAVPGSDNSSVHQVLLHRNGAIAWIGEDSASDDKAVLTIRKDQDRPALVDRGRDIGQKSLLIVRGTPNTFSWVVGGDRKIARFGGPAIDGPAG